MRRPKVRANLTAVRKAFLSALLVSLVPAQVLAANGTTTLENDLASVSELGVAELEWQDLEQQIDAGELREAQVTLERRLRELQTVGDRYDGALVKPLSLLGRIYHSQEDYPKAAETFALATQISRIANGLHSAEQLQLVHQEIASLKAMGNIVEANSRHEYAFSIAARHYGRYAMQLIPELLRIGNWYTATGDVIGARGRFSDARVLLSARQDTAQSDLMIAALRGLARSYKDERYPPFYARPNRETDALFERNGLNDRQESVAEMTDARLRVNAMHKGTEALVDILRIEGNRLLAEQDRLLLASTQSDATAPAPAPAPKAGTAAKGQTTVDTDNTDKAASQEDAPPIVQTSKGRRTRSLNLDAIQTAVASPEVDKSDFLTAMLDLADWYLIMNQEPRAFAWYKQAYTIAEADPNSDVQALFSEPKLLYFPRPKDPKLPERLPSDALEKGHVALQYDIDHRGVVRRLKTLESHPKGMMDFHVRSSARIARYRPRIMAGLPQPTAAHGYTHSFNYFPRNKQAPPKVINTDELAKEPAPPTGVNAPPTSGR